MADASSGTIATMIDDKYEFSAPQFFDFIKGESDEDMRQAELWFESALSYGPSPFMPRIKARRSSKIVESLCKFSEEAQETQKEFGSSDSASTGDPETKSTSTRICEEVPVQAKEENTKGSVNAIPSVDVNRENEKDDSAQAKGNEILVSETGVAAKSDDKENTVCTPMASTKGEVTSSKRQQIATKIATLMKNPSVLKPKNQLQSSLSKGVRKPASVKRDTNLNYTAGTPNLAQENQAIKRQRLDGGRSRKILNPKPANLPHKTKQGLVDVNSNLCPSTATKIQKDNRKVYVREQAATFISAAEMMNKFHSSTRDLSLSSISNAISHDKNKLTLTRPKEPEFVTSQRVRPTRVKSSAELEEEMMAKLPKFKARPLNRKILEASGLPAPQRSAPKPPEFKEFRLETMARASQNAETSSTASAEPSTKQHEGWKPHRTEPRSPRLHTLMRARPTKVKSSWEIEQEELEKIPKFRARPFNKKIFESKGELGIFCNTKKHITVPQEFHFATDERIPPPRAVVDLFDKMSLSSETRHDNPLPRNTAPNPFNLRTEIRGSEKEKKFLMEVIHKEIEDERVRVPKATPYPYTTDYPVIPPKPEPKSCTKPEPFKLESLMRHEEEVKREMEERLQIEREEAQRRIFKAQPILKEDPIPLPEKSRRPLTEIQEFNLHLEHRVVERAEFDQKIKEKEMMYKRFREESEAAKMLEEERVLKQLRRTMIPHARPLPNFSNPFVPEKSRKETTKAKSPKLRVLRGKERRKPTYPYPLVAASSAAVAQMR